MLKHCDHDGATAPEFPMNQQSIDCQRPPQVQRASASAMIVLVMTAISDFLSISSF